jgi:hypothetical protein
MKYKYTGPVILSIGLSMLMTVQPLFPQQGDHMINRAEKLEQETPRKSDNDTVVRSRPDTTVISIGSRTIRIIEKNGSTDVNIDREDRRTPARQHRPRPFKGHWSGLEIGLNNYMDSDFGVNTPPGAGFMELHAARSLNVNLNFLQYNLTLRQNNIGLVTGAGLEMNNYRFSNNVSITREDGVIVPVEYGGTGINLDRSRLRTWHITVPLLLEFQTGHAQRNHRGHISAGVIGGLNIGSNTRVVYRDNSRRYRDRVRDDLYLVPFRYGLTVRAGYRSLNLYANYYPSGLFQENKGPELYPVAIGFSVIGF